MNNSNEEVSTHKFIVGYLHVNNPNSREFMIRKMSLSNLIDIWRTINPNCRQYTFNKKQTRNYTRARLDNFLAIENSTKIIGNVQIGLVCSMSDHRPIHLHMSFSKVPKGKGFWRMRNELLTYIDFIHGCNEVIKNTLVQYSGQLRLDRMTFEPTNEQYASKKFYISFLLLHDVILLEVRTFVMKNKAMKRRKSKEKTLRKNYNKLRMNMR